MKNLPQTIWLNIGEQADIKDAVSFKELTEVTWSEHKISSGDVKYIREKIANNRIRAINQSNLDLVNEAISKFERTLHDGDGIRILKNWKRVLEGILKIGE